MNKSKYSKPSIKDIRDYKKPDAKLRKEEKRGYFFNRMEKVCKSIQKEIQEKKTQEKEQFKIQENQATVQKYLSDCCRFATFCPHPQECYNCLSEAFPFLPENKKVGFADSKVYYLDSPKHIHRHYEYLTRRSILCQIDNTIFHAFISELCFQSSETPPKLHVQVSLMNQSLPYNQYSRFNYEKIYTFMTDELTHIIWKCIKNTNSPIYTDKIFFGFMLDYLHLRIATYFSDISEKHFLNPGYATDEEKKKKKSDWQYHFMKKYYNNMTPKEYQDMQQILVTARYSPYAKFKAEKKENHNFFNLTSELKKISNSNIDIIQQISILLAKIYLGRTFLKEYKNKINISNVTLILCDNPPYLVDFFKDILTISTAKNIGPLGYIFGENYIDERTELHHLTTFTVTDLAKTDNLLDRIKHKILGNIVNIDSSDKTLSNKNDIATLGKLFRGAPISITDSFNTKFCFKSNAHYIFIRRFQEASIQKILPPDATCIRLSSSLWDLKYFPLEFYELFFLVTGFVEYGIEQLFSISLADGPANSTTSSLDFITTYCIETRDINDVCLTKELYEKYVKYTEQVPDSYQSFASVFKTAFPNLEYKSGKQRIDRRKSTKFGKAHSATGHGYIGLKFDAEKYNKDLQLRQTKQSPLSASEDFNHYIEQLIKDYYPEY